MPEKQALKVHSGNAVINSRRERKWTDQYDCQDLNRILKAHKLTCTHLVHFTENESAKEIGLKDDSPFCFKAFMWRPVDMRFYLTWWSALPPDRWERVIWENVANVSLLFVNQLGTSAAFNGESLCGPIGFAVSWENILNEYAMSRIKTKNTNKIQLRIFGTFGYKSEIMYAVLVCIEGDKYVEEFPLVHCLGTEVFECIDGDENFIWNVYSTIGFIRGRNSKEAALTWDHISFAFNFPDSDPDKMLKIPPQLCSIKEKKASEYSPESRSQGRESKARDPDRNVVCELKKKTEKVKTVDTQEASSHNASGQQPSFDEGDSSLSMQNLSLKEL